MPFWRFKRAKAPREEETGEPEEDVEFLLPPSDGKRHKRIRQATHSLTYIFISCAAAFILVTMAWLGPGFVRHDLRGIGSQSHASIGYVNQSVSLATQNTTDDGGHKQASAPVTPAASAAVKEPPKSVMPHHQWNPLLYDPAPITHIYVKPCIFPPWSFPSYCSPPESAKDVALYGKWVRVPRDVSKGTGHYYTEIYYRRAQVIDTSQLGIQPVTGLRLLEDRETKNPEIAKEIARDEWEPAGEDLRTGVWPAKVEPAKLWLTRSPSYNGSAQAVQPINELNVIWSDHTLTKPWWGFERIPGKPVFDDDNTMDHMRCDIVVRRELVKPPPTPQLSFREGGKFKILQIADLHYSATGGKCHSASLLPQCHQDGSDTTTSAWLSELMDRDRPDLVVLAGDQLLGSHGTFDTLTVLTKIGHVFADKGVPWTVVFGNHDKDRTLATDEQMYVLKHMPYFVGKAGPGVEGFEEEHNVPRNSANRDMGVGNYVLRVAASQVDPTQVLSLYFLDSHDYPPMTLAQIWNIAMGSGVEYDWLRASQISWYKNESDHQPMIRRPYRPAYAREGGKPKPVSGGELKKPTGMMFFHIPLPEAYERADKNETSGGEMVYGNQKEGRLAPTKDEGFFERAILSTKDGHSDQPEIRVISNGHAHLTDTCRRHRGVWNCFSGGASYSAVGRETWERRVRFYEIENYGEVIRTYQVLDPRAEGVDKGANRFGELLLYDSQST